MTKILVIEDAPLLREHISQVLGFEDYEVYSAPDGSAGIDMEVEVQPDLIVSDIMLPGADGYQVLQFTSNQNFTTTNNGTDRYPNAPGTYRIRYKQVSGSALDVLLATRPNATVCWNFQFLNSGDTASQPSVSYCR